MTAICTKGSNQYDTINAAVKAEGEEPVVLTANVTEDVIIPQNRYATIDLAGHTLTSVASHAITVERYATLTIMTSVDGGIVDSVVNGKAALYVMPLGSATVESGKLTRSKEDSKDNTWYVVWNQGELVIAGGSVSNSSTLSSAIENGFDSSRESDVEAFNSVGDEAYVATTTISGGTVTTNVIGLKNDEHSMATITGGKIVAKTQAVLNWNICNITGGTLNSSGTGVVVSNGTYNGSAGKLTISGGQFNTLVKTDEIVQPLPSYESENIVISGGDFAKAPQQKYCAPGVVFLTDAKGRVTVSNTIWQYPDGGVVGGGFNGFRRLIMRADSVDYTAGGFDIPAGFNADSLMEASVKGGVLAWYDRANRKVVLYTANGKEATGTLTDVSIVLIGH